MSAGRAAPRPRPPRGPAAGATSVGSSVALGTPSDLSIATRQSHGRSCPSAFAVAGVNIHGKSGLLELDRREVVRLEVRRRRAWAGCGRSGRGSIPVTSPGPYSTAFVPTASVSPCTVSDTASFAATGERLRAASSASSMLGRHPAAQRSGRKVYGPSRCQSRDHRLVGADHLQRCRGPPARLLEIPQPLERLGVGEPLRHGRAGRPQAARGRTIDATTCTGSSNAMPSSGSGAATPAWLSASATAAGGL